MELRGMIPMLSCANVSKSVEFYSKALGFTVQDHITEKGKFVWACIQSGKVVLMLTQDTSDPSSSAARKVYEAANPGEPRGGLSFYYYPDDLNALYDELRLKRLRPGSPRVAAYGMKEFTLRDPDNYQLLFGQQTSEPPTVEKAVAERSEKAAKAEKAATKPASKSKKPAPKSGKSMRTSKSGGSMRQPKRGGSMRQSRAR